VYGAYLQTTHLGLMARINTASAELAQVQLLNWVGDNDVNFGDCNVIGADTCYEALSDKFGGAS
jgi:hypothetical protein